MENLLTSIKGIISWSQNETFPDLFTINTELGIMYLSSSDIKAIVDNFNGELLQWKEFMDEVL